MFELEVGSDGGLAHAVVSLVDVASGVAVSFSASQATLDQRRCRFEPHIIFAEVGQVVEILNNDPVTHNVHTVAFDNRTFNRSQPPTLQKIEATKGAPPPWTPRYLFQNDAPSISALPSLPGRG